MSVARVLPFAVIAAVITGCSSTTVCAPGSTAACTCTDGRSGAQSCNGAGSGYDECVCTSGLDGGADAAVDGGADAGDPGGDAGGDSAIDGGPTVCASDADCDDGRFCTGAERCDPSAAGADAFGCVEGTAPCVGMACVEATDSCASCSTMGDVDADGHRARSCGGDDCDDDDAEIFPGAIDDCDGIDDDCDGTVDDEPLASALCESGRTCVSSTCSLGVITRDIAIGPFGSCALLSDGTVLCAGSDMHGALGNGAAGDSLTHVMPSGLDDVVGVACASEYCCALDAAGTLSCFGRNSGYVLESPDTTVVHQSPIALTAPTGSTAVATQVFFACTLDAAGLVRCWGGSIPSLGLRLTPQEISFPSPVVQIALGGSAGCALRDTGSVMCWGSDANLAPGSSGSPAMLEGVSGVRAIAAASATGCALLTDATVSCWGSNDSGQLGRDVATWPQPPTAVPGLSGIVWISAGAQHFCALRNTGQVLCWGGNSHGPIGNGTRTNAYAPTAVTGLPPADGVWAGGETSNSTCAHTIAGVYCWGDDTHGQLGDGVTGMDHVAPVRIGALP